MPLLDSDRCIRYLTGTLGAFSWSGGGSGEIWVFEPVMV
jgi:hypothetical protein